MSLFLVFFVLASSNETGITVPLQKMEVVGDATGEVIIGRLPRYEKKSLFFFSKDGAEWELVDSVSYKGIIPKGEKWVIEINSGLNISTPDGLSSTALEAMELVPDWLKPGLEANFRRMDETMQKDYASFIKTAPEKHIDEVAFCVAHIDPEVLHRYPLIKDLLLENARLIYAYDTLLKYVELVEHPDYTTAKYKISDHGSDTTEIEIPYERYYWDIVHPVLTEEAALYINPKTGGRANPPTGRFWREYLFSYPDTAEKTVWDWGNPPKDTIYAGFVSPILRDELAKAEVLSDGKVDTLDESATGVVTQWIKDVMVFNSGFGFQRPVQPVRIYHIHLGRCGEHGDITEAAGRAALIPTNSPLTMCNDHVWNEWYDTQWRGWEPVNTFINSTHHYDNWWDIVLPFNFRGDGWIWDVTERYTEHCTLTVKVEDAKGNPVDGARVTVASSDNSGNYIVIAAWHYTSSSGETQFIIGDDKPYYARIDAGDMGSHPSNPNQVTQVIPKSVAGKHYSWSHRLSGNMPKLSVSSATLPQEPDSLYKIALEFETEDEIIYGKTRFQNELRINQEFARFISEGNIEFFICDSLNFSLYEKGDPFKAFCIGEDASDGDISFILPKKGKWYAVLSNEDVTTVGENCSLICKLFRAKSGTPLDFDAGTDAITMPHKVQPNDSVIPKATVGNYGKEVISFDVECTIEPGGYTNTKTVTDLESSNTGEVEFEMWVPTECGDYIITVTTLLSGDGNPENDTKEEIISVIGITEKPALCGFDLSCIRPNPMSNQTVISYQLPVISEISLAIYDISGKLVKTLAAERKEAGSYTITWDGRNDHSKNVPAGIYFVRLLTPEYKATRKVVLLTR